MFKWVLVGLFVSASVQAQAESIVVSSISGQLENFSGLSSEAFSAQQFVSCRTRDGSFCGLLRREVPVQADGRFVFNEVVMELDAEPDSMQVHYNLLSPQTNPLRPQDAVDADLFISTGDVEVKLLRAETWVLDYVDEPSFTLLEILPGRLDIALTTGEDVETWLAGPGRDRGLDIRLHFDPSRLYQAETEFMLRQSGLSQADWTRVPHRFILLQGDQWGPQPEIMVEFDLFPDDSIFELKAFTSDLGELLGTIVLDPTRRPQESPEHKVVDGSHTQTYMNFDYDLVDELEFPSLGGSYATFNMECRSGEIVGEMILRDSQLPPGNETLRGPLSGVCEGEEGEVHFSIPRKAGGELAVRAPFHRISVQSWRTDGAGGVGKSFKVELSRVGLEPGFDGSDLSSSLPLFDESGAQVGEVSIY